MKRLALVAWVSVTVIAVTVSRSIGGRMEELDGRVTTLIEEERPMTVEWKHRRANGFIMNVSVSVPQGEGEGDDAWAARAAAKIAAMEAKFPPNVEQ